MKTPASPRWMPGGPEYVWCGLVWVRVLLWNACVYIACKTATTQTSPQGQMVPWAHNPMFNSPPFLLATFMIIIFYRQLQVGASGPGSPGKQFCRSDGRPKGLSQAPGPPESIFRNKFHSHFLGTGRKVPESREDNVIKETPSMLPRAQGRSPHSWHVGNSGSRNGPG